MKFKTNAVSLILFGLFFLLLGGQLSAQAVLSVKGKVGDEDSGARLSRVKVKLISGSGKTLKTLYTTTTGVFELSLKTEKNYVVSISKQGFKTKKISFDTHIGECTMYAEFFYNFTLYLVRTGHSPVKYVINNPKTCDFTDEKNITKKLTPKPTVVDEPTVKEPTSIIEPTVTVKPEKKPIEEPLVEEKVEKKERPDSTLVKKEAVEIKQEAEPVELKIEPKHNYSIEQILTTTEDKKIKSKIEEQRQNEERILIEDKILGSASKVHFLEILATAKRDIKIEANNTK